MSEWLSDYGYSAEPDPNLIVGNVVGVSFVEGYPSNLIRLHAVRQEIGVIKAVIKRNPVNKYDSNACEVWVLTTHEDRCEGCILRGFHGNPSFETEYGIPANLSLQTNETYQMIGHLAKELAAELAPQLDSGVEFDIQIVSIGFANNDPSKPGASFHIRKV